MGRLGMKKRNTEIISYVIVCLLLSNICWYLGYKNLDEPTGAFPMVMASFMPMFLALIFVKIFKGSYNELGIRLNIKGSWKIYLLAFVFSVILCFLAVPLMLLIFKGKVTLDITRESLFMLVLTPVIGILSCIEMLGEELGWIGYLYPKLEKTAGTVSACILLGIIRGLFHFMIIFAMDFTVYGLIELTVSNVLLSFLMIYLYKKSNSLFPCCLLHACTNFFPIIITYDKAWYYTSVYPMAVSMIPALLVFAYCVYQLKKQNLFLYK